MFNIHFCRMKNIKNKSILLLIAALSCFLLDSCKTIVKGCTDEQAENFDSEANENCEGCCEYKEGCLDSSADNYDADAIADCECCNYDVTYKIGGTANSYDVTYKICTGNTITESGVDANWTLTCVETSNLGWSRTVFLNVSPNGSGTVEAIIEYKGKEIVNESGTDVTVRTSADLVDF